MQEVEDRVEDLAVPLVEVTGGEPLAQSATPELVSRLCDLGYEVLVETGGHHDVSVLDRRAHVILDVKTPGSGMAAHNDLENLNRIGEGDEIKLVLRNGDNGWVFER